MSNQNRSRLAVDLAADWRPHTVARPACEMLGTVTRDGETGALARTEANIYIMLIGPVSHSLDQRKVKAALGISNGAGRPAELEGGRRMSVFLDDVSIARASALGNGNVSEGIRIALQNSSESV